MYDKKIYKKIEYISSYISYGVIVILEYRSHSVFYFSRFQIDILITIIIGNDIDFSIFSRSHPNKLPSLKIFGFLNISLGIEDFMESFNESFTEFKSGFLHIFLAIIYDSLHITTISSKNNVVFVLGSPEKRILEIRECIIIDYFSDFIIR